jgi:formylglycine-generating enzyme required for sulfatase activity
VHSIKAELTRANSSGNENSPLPGEERYDPDAGMMFVWIPAGTFSMGSPGDEIGRFDDEELPHPVTIPDGFWLGRTAVTQEQWWKVMEGNPSYFMNAGPNAPVEQVSCDDCQEFVGALIEKSGRDLYRMPTEEEWEYACRAGTVGPFYRPVASYLFENCNTDNPDPPLSELDTIAWWCGNAGDTTHPVGQKLPNAWGLHDMLGNVWEWAMMGNTEKGNYAATLPPGALQAIRGGPWYGMPRCVRCADRHSMSSGFRSSGVGFRIARCSSP